MAERDLLRVSRGHAASAVDRDSASGPAPVGGASPPNARRLMAAGMVGVALVQGVWLLLLWLPPLPDRLDEVGSRRMLFDDGSTAFVFLAPDDRYRIPVTAEELVHWNGSSGRSGSSELNRAGTLGVPPAVDPAFLRALIRFEDKRFFRHMGLDPLALARAVFQNLRAGQVVSGGSTLTLQLVRVLEPRPRTVRSKIIEVIRAAQIEVRRSKREVLAAYLTFAPYGRNVEGVRAASWAYFGHGPERLSADQIATLLAVPQNPNRRSPSAAHAVRLREARDGIGARLARWGMLEPFDGEVIEVPQRLRPLPRLAPHAAFWLRHTADEGRSPTVPPQRTDTATHTHLDRGLQQTAEQILDGHRARLSGLGIHNAAVVLVDNETAAVRALVGNFDFWDGERSGQVPGFAIPRSPGSALKPLIYALALQRGHALPEHLVVDAPVRYGDYAPENYDGSYVGLIRLDEALALSLNTPFVRLLSTVGMEPFLEHLADLGVAATSRAPGTYGLSAALGALEVSPLEMARIVRLFATGGRDRPLQVLHSHHEKDARDQQVLDPAVAFLVRRALSSRDRPDFPARREATGRTPPIFWKTGTSYGHRDAWAVGAGARYTAVVWLGNFDASPAFDLVGADAAGPVLFDLLEALESAVFSNRRASQEWPEDLQTVQVCAWSGHLPTSACPLTHSAAAPRHSVASKRCPLHAEIEVDRATGFAVLPGCRQGREVETRSIRVWPDAVRDLFLRRGTALPQPPPLAPECAERSSQVAIADRLRIVSPRRGERVMLIPGIEAAEQEIPLLASGAEGRLTWFENGRLLGRVPAGEELWWRPRPGTHRLLVQAAGGSRSEITVVVGRATEAAPSVAGR